MAPTDVSRANRLSAASLGALLGTAGVLAMLPVGWRGPALLAGLLAVAALGIVGGMAGRRALQAGAAPHPGRTIAVSIAGLTLGATAGVVAVLAAMSLVL
jgi:hypothetical protein